MSSYSVLPNSIPINGLYSGSQYAFGASGGYNVLQTFNQIKEREPDIISKYDVTDAVQVFFSARTLNSKLGIIKDSSNVYTVQAPYDPINDKLQFDTIKICACDFINGINTDSVISVGKLNTLYKDFRSCVLSYFGDPGGFASLFAGDQDFEVNNGIFDSSALIQVVNSSTFNMVGSFISDLSGNVTISDINKHLEFAVDTNIFNNRNPYLSLFNIPPITNSNTFTLTSPVTTGKIESGTFLVINGLKTNNPIFIVSITKDALPTIVIDQVITTVSGTANTIHNWGVVDGFVSNDLIFIPTGFTITLSLDVQCETYLPINNIGPANLNAMRNKLNWTRGYVSRSTTSTTTNITQTTTLPILLVLSDTYLDNYTNFGKSWSVAPISLNNGSNNNSSNNWLAMSLSATGKYQTIISASGDILNTSDYGYNWVKSTNIGNSDINNISISYTGANQTASNGHSIYVSNNYGLTWNKTFDGGTSNIFVSISLTGKYQTVISSGDNLYTSMDYGITWTPLDQETDLYQSIEAFPTGGIALSYTGQYQTIVIEHIYVSNDYGYTWNNSGETNGFDDKNWEGIAMSSDGKYQTAIENGGDIHISSDYGNVWLFVDDPAVQNKIWQYVAVSATGQYQTVMEYNGNMFTSNDFGATWNMVDNNLVTNKYWQMVAVSSDALIQTAIESNGLVYTSNVFTAGTDGTINAGGSTNALCICD